MRLHSAATAFLFVQMEKFARRRRME
jgi:hypothetical protein